jgi:hypothetical protein
VGLPPFNNPFDYAGGFELRTRGVGPGFHFRLPYRRVFFLVAAYPLAFPVPIPSLIRRRILLHSN